MRWALAYAAALVVAAGGAFGQGAAAPAFDVASVKPSPAAALPGGGGRGEGLGALLGIGGGRGGRIVTSPDGVTLRNATLSACMQWAYDVKDYQISGPGWLSEDRYDIVAKAAGPTPEDQLKRMLQSLLAERFHLAFHRQTKDLQAYALVVGKGGSKLKESEGDGPTSIQRNGLGFTIERATVDQLTQALSQVLRLPVFDMTGLIGRYDATVDIMPYIPLDSKPGDPPPDIASIAITAVQDLLGLKLEARKVPVEILVVDHADKEPTEN
ncbi:MAG: TIGR03435 family protein [Bryobacteraceae bacterium]|jgi:uncharacterized protein (TIGR03435 family)